MNTPDSSYREIPLTRGQVVLVDASDYDRVSSHKWFAQWQVKAETFYAARNIVLPDGRKRIQLMHRFIFHDTLQAAAEARRIGVEKYHGEFGRYDESCFNSH